MNVNEINLAGTAAALNKEAVQLNTLPIDAPFIIVNLKVCKGPFGECILAELDEKSVWLPKRSTSIIKKKLKDFTARKYSLVPKGTKSSDTPNSKYKDIQLFEINPV
jgi:hypothetical protein